MDGFEKLLISENKLADQLLLAGLNDHLVIWKKKHTTSQQTGIMCTHNQIKIVHL
jgi:hypothetical protein